MKGMEQERYIDIISQNISQKEIYKIFIKEIYTLKNS